VECLYTFRPFLMVIECSCQVLALEGLTGVTPHTTLTYRTRLSAAA
jgi:hypothetical protein